MISTSSYDNWKSDRYTTYSISGKFEKNVNYQGEYYSKLAPKLSFWVAWKNDVGMVSSKENNLYYVQEYWRQVLSKLDPKQVYKELDNSVLLCHESNTEFCHRHIVAAWLELSLGVKVPEKIAIGDVIEELERPAYIKEYLKEVMNYNRDTKGFNSLKALSLFEEAEKLEDMVSEFESIIKEIDGESFNGLDGFQIDALTSKREYCRQAVCYFLQKASFLRADADKAEEQYNKEHGINPLVKVKKFTMFYSS